jgi:hypothetical protein
MRPFFGCFVSQELDAHNLWQSCNGEHDFLNQEKMYSIFRQTEMGKPILTLFRQGFHENMFAATLTFARPGIVKGLRISKSLCRPTGMYL